MSENSIIRLFHGEGGSATLKLIKEEILSRFGNPILNSLEDGCLISADSNNIIISTDSYIVDPIIFPGGDIGKLSIAGTVNDLIAAGAIPQYLTLSLILADGLEMTILRQILDSAKVTADSIGIKVVGGDIKVLKLNDQIRILINTTGFGIPIKEGTDFSVSNAQIGDDIILTGTIGDHSLAILSIREGLGFEQRVSSDCAPLSDLIIPLIKKLNSIHCLRDPTRGGVAGVLCDIAETSSVDLRIEEDKIPIKQEVLFGCEMLGIEPLRLVNEGKMIMVVDSKHTDEILRELRQNKLGIDSRTIGKVCKTTSSLGRVILRNGYKEKILHRLEGEPIPRLC